MISLQVFRAPTFCVAIELRENKKRRENVMSVTQTVEASKIEAIPAPFPETKGIATLKILNSDPSLGPAVALLRMEPGSGIPRHLHERTTEMSYVLDGDFINEGISYPKGTEINIKPNTIHGPHYDEDRMLRPGNLQLSICSR
jgi:quercetin dioxygenase-like cupin family protein